MNEVMQRVSLRKLEQVLGRAFGKPSRGFTVIVTNLNLESLASRFEEICTGLRYEVRTQEVDRCGAFEQNLNFWLGSWQRKEAPQDLVIQKQQPFDPRLQNHVLAGSKGFLLRSFSDEQGELSSAAGIVMVVTLIWSAAPRLNEDLSGLAQSLMQGRRATQKEESQLDLAEWGFIGWTFSLASWILWAE